MKKELYDGTIVDESVRTLICKQCNQYFLYEGKMEDRCPEHRRDKLPAPMSSHTI